MIPVAAEVVAKADILLVIGTSLSVYPAAGLVHEVQPGTPVVLVDPGEPESIRIPNLHHIKEKAGEGVPALVSQLLRS